MRTVLLYTYLRFVVMTSRIRIAEADDEARTILTEGRPAVFVFWQRHIYFFLYFFGVRRFWMLLNPRHKNEPTSVIAPWFGLAVARGSTEGGGRHALVTLMEKIKQGGQVALSADGERGQPRHCKASPFILAQETSVPIIPTSWKAKWHWVKKSAEGDGDVVIPLPFNRIEITLAHPVVVTKHHNFNDLDDIRNRLKQQLDQMSHFVSESQPS